MSWGVASPAQRRSQVALVQLTEQLPVQVTWQIELPLQDTLPLAPTVGAQVEFPVQSTLQDSRQLPLQLVWFEQVRLQLPASDPPQVAAEKAQLPPELHEQLAPLQVGAGVEELPQAPAPPASITTRMNKVLRFRISSSYAQTAAGRYVIRSRRQRLDVDVVVDARRGEAAARPALVDRQPGLRRQPMRAEADRVELDGGDDAVVGQGRVLEADPAGAQDLRHERAQRGGTPVNVAAARGLPEVAVGLERGEDPLEVPRGERALVGGAVAAYQRTLCPPVSGQVLW